MLPLKRTAKIAVIGEFAKKPRYQGAGSSLINPTRLSTVFDELTAGGFEFTYSRGYDVKIDHPDPGLISAACIAAEKADVVLIFAGLTDRYESEGFDRDNMEMPASHNELIARVSAANRNTVVILSGGSPVEMPWIGGVKGLLQSHLGGQAGASAVVDVIFGAVNPSGKLAETYPIGLSDTPCFRYFGKGSDTAEYRESIYVGYRYYDTAGRDVLFPFGFGLSYTQFEYSNISVSGEVNAESDTLTVNVQVKNIGDRAGAEVVQLYVKPPKSAVFKAEKELKGFEKVFLEPGETKTVSFILNRRTFSYYNTLVSDWHAEEGLYDILIGASSRDIRLRSSVSVENRATDIPLPDLRGKCPCYYDIGNKEGFEIPDSDFENLYGGKLPPGAVKIK
jgi:beta-glucosidase